MMQRISERISVVIPVRDEAGNIGPLIEETFEALAGEDLAEIIVVDDGSTDGTAAEVMALARRLPKVKLLRHIATVGQSAAVRTGVRFATGPLVATMDGDGQNDPRDIARLAGMLCRAGHETALAGGIRTSRKAEASKRLASRFANWLRNSLLDDGCPDTGCGIKVFRRDIFLDLPYFSGMHRYLPALFMAYGYEAIYAPVNDRPRLVGRSKYTNLGRALIGTYDLAGVRWLLRRTQLSPVGAPMLQDCDSAALLPAPGAVSQIGPAWGIDAPHPCEETTPWPKPRYPGSSPTPLAN